tara:strand:+ start:311 stop:694 length:384 start_codon:yes stop_codon:yes gene_type:complete
MKKVNDSLTEEELIVLRDKGTERAFSGKFDSFYEDGTYKCKNCGQELFKSETKYNAGCGWPSFFEAVNEKAIIYREDHSILGRPRTEILCSNCEGHLGHVFDDGPVDKTGLRYCVNSISLDFDSENK